MGKYSGLFVDQLKGQFLTAYEGAYQKLWSAGIANFFEVDHEIVKYDDLGSIGAVREWVQDRFTQDPIPFTQEIRNKVYEIGASISVDDVRRDTLGLFDAKINEGGQKMMLYRDNLVASLITSNGNCLDGTAFFGTHNVGNSGAQKNLCVAGDIASYDVVVATAPTAVEMASVLVDSVTHFFTLKDEAGDPINGGASDFTILTSNPKIYASATNAVWQTQLSQGETNPVQGYRAKGFKFDTVLSPLLGATTSAAFYVVRNDSPVKPFIVQEELAPEFQYLGPGSDYAITKNKYFFGVKSILGAGYGRWQHALKGILS